MLPEALKVTAEILFPALYDQSKVNATLLGRKFDFQNFSDGACRGVDIGPYRFITQNPNKTSKWAELACNGSKVGWVIHETEGWKARYVDGEVKLL